MTELPDANLPPTSTTGIATRLTMVPARMGSVLLSHGTTDFFSMMIIPILPVLKMQVGTNDAGGAKVIMVGSIASGLVQPIAAWITDRLDTRALGPLGLVLAAAALAFLGRVDSLFELMLLWGVATIGIGMFHPVVAAAIGQLSGGNRSRGVAFFFVAGMVGHALGANVSPWWEIQFSTSGYVYMLIPGAVVALILYLGIGRIPHRHEQARSRAQAMSVSDHRVRWAAIAVLYVGNILRFTVNMALLTLLWLWAEETTRQAHGVEELTGALNQQASLLTGRIETGLILGMALGGIGAGALIKPGREKWLIISTGCVGVPAIVMMAIVSQFWLAFLFAIISGIGFAAATPLSLALGQRLLPHRTGLASGLMLGGAWMFAAMGPFMAERVVRAWDIATGFGVAAGLLLLATILTFALPGALVRGTAVER
ncbi:MAG: MFS transporter [Planctomycetes bacterium]|nr:MFS transporter [Planctomycetota bacterium]